MITLLARANIYESTPVSVSELSRRIESQVKV